MWPSERVLIRTLTHWYSRLPSPRSDFRVKKSLLSDLRYAVFGLGNSLYKDNFNRVAREIDVALAALSYVLKAESKLSPHLTSPFLLKCHPRFAAGAGR